MHSYNRHSLVNDWINELKCRGIDQYNFNDLPKDLKDLKAHRGAIARELVERIGKSKELRRITWKIKK